MTRIDDLQKRYPSIPRDVIVKYDFMVRGVRGSDGLDKVSEWRPGGAEPYQNKDFDGTLQHLAEKMPQGVKPGYMLRHPKSLRFKSGLGTEIRLRSTSTYAIREISENKYALYDGEDRVEDVYFISRQPRTTPEPVTSKGTPISTLLDIRPRCFQVTLTRHCQYFSVGEQCKFCNFNVGHEAARSIGLDVPVTINLEEAVEAFKIRSSEVRQLEGFILMGGVVRADQEARIFFDFVEKLAVAESYKPNLGVHTQAMDRKDMQRLKHAGADSFSIQIEVMDPQLFPEICPGKEKHTPYEQWIEAFHDAVDIFGVGNVAGKLVPGVTLLSPNGHNTWQEARDYHIGANRWMIKNGILPSYVPLWWAPGSAYGEDPCNLDKFPPTEYHLEVALAHHEAMLEFGLYEKMNKFIYCALDCVGIYSGDIGMLNIAGDIGNWMSDVVPDEANWMARFVESAKSPAKAQ